MSTGWRRSGPWNITRAPTHASRSNGLCYRYGSCSEPWSVRGAAISLLFKIPGLRGTFVLLQRTFNTDKSDYRFRVSFFFRICVLLYVQAKNKKRKKNKKKRRRKPPSCRVLAYEKMKESTKRCSQVWKYRLHRAEIRGDACVVTQNRWIESCKFF